MAKMIKLLGSVCIAGVICSYFASAQIGETCDVLVLRSVEKSNAIELAQKIQDQKNNPENSDEIVSQKPDLGENMQTSERGLVKGLKLATFLPAQNYVFSILSAATGQSRFYEDGDKIEAVLCTATDPLPSQFELKLVTKHIPLYLSPDFDKPDSYLLKIYYHPTLNNGSFQFDFDGGELSHEQRQILNGYVQQLNAGL